VTFDDRGHFSEPHTGRTFGLGTISVRNYLSSIGEPKWIEPSVTTGGIITCGPSGRYGAVLFCEKEGFLPLFEAAQFARRYDIAGMSTKGMSVTAARHLVDEICSKSVPLLVLHDFDKSGFSILGTLCRDTRRYSFSSKPNVIDFGLRLHDVEALGVQAEKAFDRGTVEQRSQNLKVNGATVAEIDFLLHQRVELNALTSDQLVAFIEGKLKEHRIRKIVPNRETLDLVYQASVRGHAIKRAFAKIVREKQAEPVTVPRDLSKQVKALLNQHPHISWDAAVAMVAASPSRLDFVSIDMC
jgi:hypothetical protein